MANEIRNTSHIELPTDLRTKEGRPVAILPHCKLDTSNIDEKSLKASLESGRLKGYLDKKLIIQGITITGDAKKIEKMPVEEVKKVEAKIEAKKEEVKAEAKVKKAEVKKEEVKVEAKVEELKEEEVKVEETEELK